MIALRLIKAFGVGNNLTFKTKGDFVNNSNLVVGNSASVEGATIQNNANAEISSINTRIQANKLDNFGLIDGDTTVIKPMMSIISVLHVFMVVILPFKQII